MSIHEFLISVLSMLMLFWSLLLFAVVFLRLVLFVLQLSLASPAATRSGVSGLARLQLPRI